MAYLKVAKGVDLKSSHHKKTICNYAWQWMLIRLIVVIVSQYRQASNHYAACLKQI